MKRIRTILGILSLFVVLLGTGVKVDAASKEMHRLYNPNSGEHFYTADTKEKDNVMKAGWKDEGIGWTAPDAGKEVYRLYNPNAGDHHYTLLKSEKDNLVTIGWKDEGIGWYSDEKEAVPLYRAYNPNALAGSHNFTVDKTEQSGLVKVGWKDEGIGWYGVEAPKEATETFKITVKYVDENDKEIKTATTKAVEKGKEFSVSAPAIKGYDIVGDEERTIKSVTENKTITFVYKKNGTPITEKFTITVRYVDMENREIKKSTQKEVEKGKSFTATALEIDKYTLQGERTQTIASVTKDQFLEFKYQKTSVVNKEKVVFSGYATNANGDMKSKKLELKKDGITVEEILSDAEGYFFTHLILGETYVLDGEEFEVTIIAKDVDKFDLTPTKGKITIGKRFNTDAGASSLKPSVIYLDESRTQTDKVNDDFSQVQLAGKLDIRKNDIIVTPPTTRYPSGIALKVTQVSIKGDETILETAQPQLDEVIQSLDGNTTVGLDQATFIPEEGVEVLEQPQKVQTFIEGNIDETLETKISLGRQYKNSAIELNGFIDFGGKLDINAQAGIDIGTGFYHAFDVKAILQQRVHGDIKIKGNYDSKEELRLGEIVVPTPIPTVSVNIPVYLLVNAKGEATLTFDASVIESAGIKKEKTTNDINVYPEQKDMVQIPAPKFNFEGKFDAKLGVQASVSANILQMDMANINGRTGLGYACEGKVASGEGASFKQRAYAFGSVDASSPFINWKQDIFPHKEWTLWEKDITEPIGSGDGSEGKGENPDGEDPNENDGEHWVGLTSANFPDKYFLETISNNHGLKRRNRPGLDYEEIEVNSVEWLRIGGLFSDSTGLKLFKNLKWIEILSAYNVTEIDLSALNKLRYVLINRTAIRSLDVSQLKNLEELIIHENDDFSSITLQGADKLKKIDASYCNLSQIDARNLPSLETLYCHTNRLSDIQLSGSKNIVTLYLSHNNLENLNLVGLINLTNLDASYNKLTEIDFRGIFGLYGNRINIGNNNISFIDMSDRLDNHYASFIADHTIENNSVQIVVQYLNRQKVFQREDGKYVELY